MTPFNKKADERMLSFYWIVIFVLIAVGVVSATISFYSLPTDIREIEAGILNDKIIECLAEKGTLIRESADSIKKDGSNLEEICNLNFRDSNYKENQFFVKIGIGSKEIIFSKDGSENFEAFCSSENAKGNVPACNKEKILVLDSENKFILISILSSINKIEQNEK